MVDHFLGEFWVKKNYLLYFKNVNITFYIEIINNRVASSLHLCGVVLHDIQSWIHLFNFVAHHLARLVHSSLEVVYLLEEYPLLILLQVEIDIQ